MENQEGDYVNDHSQSIYIDPRLEERLERNEQKQNIGSGEDQNIDVPSLRVNLYPHQKTSVYMMERVERERMFKIEGDMELSTNMSVFGDKPGFGKTLAFLSLVVRDKMPWKEDGEYFYYNQTIATGSASTYNLVKKIKMKKINCTLVVASSSIVGQWENEIKRTNLKYSICCTRKSIEQLTVENYDIVVVSSTMYNDLMKKYQNLAWKRFAFDEAASTRIVSMNHIYAGFYWFITATFPALDRLTGRKEHFLRSVFKYMSPELFNMMLVKNSDLYVASSFSMPSTRYVTHKCINSSISRLLLPVLDGGVNEMIAAGDVEGAIRNLGGIKESNLVDVVITKKMDELQKAQDHLRDAIKANSRRSTKETKETIKKWEEKVSEIEKTIKNIKERFNEALEGDCIICQDKLYNPVMLSCCQNIYCMGCIADLIKSKRNQNVPCPMCRTHITSENIIKIKGYGDMNCENKEEHKEGYEKKKKREVVFIDEDDDYEEKKEMKWEEHKEMSRPDTVEYILKHNPRGKFIIFSSHDASFDIIRSKLQEMNVSSVEIKGTKDVKEKKLKSYVEGDIKVIFLNAQYNGAGINLQNTSDIILYHEMPEHIMKQVIGRANRIGREIPLTVHQLK